jgi:hypothetical protein
MSLSWVRSVLCASLVFLFPAGPFLLSQQREKQPVDKDQQPSIVDKKPAFLRVYVPALADLEIDGFKTSSRGESRYFTTPALETGKTFPTR